MIHRKILGLIVGIVAAFVLLPALMSTDASAQSGMNPAWDGKTVKWTAMEGATAYQYKCSVGDLYSTTGTVTDTQVDMSSFIENCFRNQKTSPQSTVMTFKFEVTPQIVDASPESKTVSKQFIMIEVRVDTIDAEGTRTYNDTTGGTVTADGFAYSEADKVYYGFFATNDQISVTAVPNDGYQFAEFGGIGVDDEDKTDNPMELTVGDAGHTNWVIFKEDKTVKLEMGAGHAAAAQRVLESYRSKYDDVVDTSKAGLSGTTLTLIFPNEYPETVGSAHFRIMDIVSGAGLRFDNGQMLFAIGLDSIEHYSSLMEVYEELETSGAQPLAKGKKFYLLWASKVESINITIKTPKSGTVVTAKTPEDPEDWPPGSLDPATQKPKPEITIAGKQCELVPFWGPDDAGIPTAFWISDNKLTDKTTLFTGTMLAGNTYYALLGIMPSFGYYFDGANPPKAIINGKLTEHVNRIDDEAVEPGGVAPLDPAPDSPLQPADPPSVPDRPSYLESLYFIGEVYIEPDVQVQPPTGINTVANIPARSMKVSWKKVKDAAGYTLSYRQKGGKWKTKSTTKTSYTIKGMKMRKFYEFKVAAKFKDGNKTVTSQYSKPSYRFFRSVKGAAKGIARGVNLTWTKEPKANGYIAYCSTSKSMKNGKSVQLKGKNRQSYTFKGLKKGKTYYVMVRSYINKGGKKYLGVTCTIRKVKAK